MITLVVLKPSRNKVPDTDSSRRRAYCLWRCSSNAMTPGSIGRPPGHLAPRLLVLHPVPSSITVESRKISDRCSELDSSKMIGLCLSGASETKKHCYGRLVHYFQLTSGPDSYLPSTEKMGLGRVMSLMFTTPRLRGIVRDVRLWQSEHSLLCLPDFRHRADSPLNKTQNGH